MTYYEISVTGAHSQTIPDIVKVVAKNASGTTITAWNGTVNLNVTDSMAVWGANGSSHTFIPANNGIWWTSITWNTTGTNYLNATDSWFSLDVTGTSGPITVIIIPEMQEIIVPVLATMAMAVVVIRRRKRAA